MAFDPLTSIFNLGNTLVERLVPDKEKQAEAKLKLLEMQQNGELQQLAQQTDINKVEAASGNWFVAGWRPYIGWVCGTGLLTQFLLRPLVTAIAAGLGHPVDFPSLDMGTLMTLLSGMLGLSAMRSYEKSQGVAGDH